MANFAENNSTYSSADQSIFVWTYQSHQTDGGSIFQWVFGPHSSFGGATNILASGNCLSGACSVWSILDWNENCVGSATSQSVSVQILQSGKPAPAA